MSVQSARLARIRLARAVAAARTELHDVEVRAVVDQVLDGDDVPSIHDENMAALNTIAS